MTTRRQVRATFLLAAIIAVIAIVSAVLTPHSSGDLGERDDVIVIPQVESVVPADTVASPQKQTTKKKRGKTPSQSVRRPAAPPDSPLRHDAPRRDRN